MFFYRLKQFIKVLHPHLTNQDYDWAKQALTPNQWCLFLKQPKPLQRHALDVARTIEAQQQDKSIQLNADEYSLLLQAALLHDCGKLHRTPTLGQRCFLVIYDSLPSVLCQWTFFQQPYFAQAIEIGRHHAQWGRQIASAYHLDEELTEIIANHHCPRNPLEHILSQADSRC